MATSTDWFYWAILSAVFAALTAIFAKIGIQDIDSDLATLIRTAIIIVVLAMYVACTGKWSNPFELASKTWLLIGLSGLATSASWVCYLRALKTGVAFKVAPVDKLSLVLVAVLASHFWVNGHHFASGRVLLWISSVDTAAVFGSFFLIQKIR